MKNVEVVYFDMDGVLADFVLHMETLAGKTIFEMNEAPKDIIGELLDEHVPKGVFADLPPMPDLENMIELMTRLEEAGYRVEILTACSDENPVAVTEQKKAWLSCYGLAAYPFNGTQKSAEKAIFAHEKALLIDDRRKACDPFVDAGGWAIKHTSAVETIGILEVHGLI